MVKELVQIEIVNQAGQKQGQLEYDVGLLDVAKAEKLVSDVTIMASSNHKKRTAKVKSRSEVLFTNRKPHKQKGTGAARAGSARSPIWVGGGVAFGPKPRDTYYSIPKKLKARARRDALLLKVKSGAVRIIDTIDLPESKTKHMVSLLKDISCTSKTLFILDSLDRNVLLASRNIAGIACIQVQDVSVFDLVAYPSLVFTKKAFDILQSNLSRHVKPEVAA